jgi:hypothetical protein
MVLSSSTYFLNHHFFNQCEKYTIEKKLCLGAFLLLGMNMICGTGRISSTKSRKVLYEKAIYEYEKWMKC